MRAIRPAQGPVLTAQHRAVRFNFARQHINWQIRHWKSILFTDESSFTESTNDRRAREWRPQGERYAECYIVEVDRYDGAPMVWTEIPLDGHTDMYVFPIGGIMAARHRSDILEHIVRPHAGDIGDAYNVMQDSAHANTAHVSMTFIDYTCIILVNWPARSPHINPTEHTWDTLSRRIRQRQHHAENVQTLMPWFRNCRPCHQIAS